MQELMELPEEVAAALPEALRRPMAEARRRGFRLQVKLYSVTPDEDTPWGWRKVDDLIDWGADSGTKLLRPLHCDPPTRLCLWVWWGAGPFAPFGFSTGSVEGIGDGPAESATHFGPFIAGLENALRAVITVSEN